MAKAKRSGNTFISNARAFDSYAKGWNLARSGFWSLLVLVFIVSLVDISSSSLGSPDTGGFILSLLLGFLLTGPIRIGSDWVFLEAARKKDYRITDIFTVFQKHYVSAVGASVLSFILVLTGLILFIIPGIVFMVRLSFVNYLIMDKGLDAWQAIKESWEMTAGHFWTIFWMQLITIPLLIFGLMLLVVGIFPVVVWISSSFAVLYNSVLLKDKL